MLRRVQWRPADGNLDENAALGRALQALGTSAGQHYHPAPKPWISLQIVLWMLRMAKKTLTIGTVGDVESLKEVEGVDVFRGCQTVARRSARDGNCRIWALAPGRRLSSTILNRVSRSADSHLSRISQLAGAAQHAYGMLYDYSLGPYLRRVYSWLRRKRIVRMLKSPGVRVASLLALRLT